MVWIAIPSGQKPQFKAMPLGKRTANYFVELVYEQVVIEIYQPIPTAIFMEVGAQIHSPKIAKKGMRTTTLKGWNAQQTHQTCT